MSVLFDFSRRPLIVYPEDCVSSVVVRTIGNREVNGLLSYWCEYETAQRKRKDLEPGAQITRGQSTLYETRIPLPGVAMRNSPYESSADRYRRGGFAGLHDEPRPQVRILPEPFEVATVYKDNLTETMGTWRLGIRVEYVKAMKKAPWYVTVLDTNGVQLSCVAVSGLDPNPEIPDPLPLNRAIQKTAAPANAWTKILDDTD